MSLFLAISQSVGTADTLAELREAKKLGYVGTCAICNVAESSVGREADLALMTRAGPEIAVASTKAFTTQLAALAMLGLAIAQRRGLDRRTVALYTRQMCSEEHTSELQSLTPISHAAICSTNKNVRRLPLLTKNVRDPV